MIQKLTAISLLRHTERLLENKLANLHSWAETHGVCSMIEDFKLNPAAKASMYGGRRHMDPDPEPGERALAFDASGDPGFDG